MPDFLQGCMSDLKTTDTKAFQETFCQRCRNRGCDHAKAAEDKFSRRVAAQPDRLFHPTQILEKIPRYAHLVEFTELKEQAEAIDISRRKKSWESPLDDPLPDSLDELDEEVTASKPPVQKQESRVSLNSNEAKRIGAAQVRPGNTPVPRGGIILGTEPLPKRTPIIEADPWAVPSDKPSVPAGKLVAPGAKVRIGG